MVGLRAGRCAVGNEKKAQGTSGLMHNLTRSAVLQCGECFYCVLVLLSARVLRTVLTWPRQVKLQQKTKRPKAAKQKPEKKKTGAHTVTHAGGFIFCVLLCLLLSGLAVVGLVLAMAKRGGKKII